MSPAKAQPKKRLLPNLKEALELHFEPPRSSRPPKVRTIGEVRQSGSMSRQIDGAHRELSTVLLQLIEGPSAELLVEEDG
jgi:hypothetical protein